MSSWTMALNTLAGVIAGLCAVKLGLSLWLHNPDGAVWAFIAGTWALLYITKPQERP